MSESAREFGIQIDGSSPFYTKEMALTAIRQACDGRQLTAVADIGGGKGELSILLAGLAREVCLVDYSPPARGALPPNISLVQADLNSVWPMPDAQFDFVFSLECVEHVENPRHFLRQFARILKPGGFGFLTTPNNHSWASKLTFLLKGQHRRFQDPSYPAHLTALLHCDLERILSEERLVLLRWIYSNCDTLPRLHWNIRLPGRAFSDSVGVLFQKPNSAS